MSATTLLDGVLAAGVALVWWTQRDELHFHGARSPVDVALLALWMAPFMAAAVRVGVAISVPLALISVASMTWFLVLADTHTSRGRRRRLARAYREFTDAVSRNPEFGSADHVVGKINAMRSAETDEFVSLVNDLYGRTPVESQEEKDAAHQRLQVLVQRLGTGRRLEDPD